VKLIPGELNVMKEISDESKFGREKKGSGG